MGLRLRRHRPLRALQVEVTSRCTRRCAVCPRSALTDRWLERDLSADTWQAVVPALGRFEHVHLQGWGEPLLHRHLRSMAADGSSPAARAVPVQRNGSNRLSSKA